MPGRFDVVLETIPQASDPTAGDAVLSSPAPSPDGVPDSLTAYRQTFDDYEASENALPRWRADPGVGPDGTTYRHLSLAHTLKPGGGVRVENPGILRVDFPGHGGCSGGVGTDNFKACNGALGVRFDEPLEGDLWLRWIDKLGDKGVNQKGEGPWWAGPAYKYLLIHFPDARPGIAIWESREQCKAGTERWAITVLRRVVCVPIGQWDGDWATWDLNLNTKTGRGALFRNGRLVAQGQIQGRGGVVEIDWGANLNHNPPAPQTRFFDLLVVYRTRPPDSVRSPQ